MKKSIGSGRGSVYNILLKALQTGDKYGYEICKEVEEKTNGTYTLKQPSLYSGLKRLEAQGQITSYWKDSVLGGRRHYYSLTDSGKEKIGKSNFTWSDTRDDIVDSLFEKSESEKVIEDAKSEIDNLTRVVNNEEIENKINDVINSTNEIVKTETESDKDIKNDEKSTIQNQYQNQESDLFSLFTNIPEKQNDSTPVPVFTEKENFGLKEQNEKQDLLKENFNKIENQTENTYDSNEQEKILKSDDDENNNITATNIDASEKNEQLNLFDYKETETQEVEQKDAIKDKDVEQEKTDELKVLENINLQQTNLSSNIDRKDQIKESNILFDKSNETLKEINKKKEENLPTNSFDAVSEYRQNHMFSNSFSNNVFYEKNEQKFFNNSNKAENNETNNDFDFDALNDYKKETEEKIDSNAEISNNNFQELETNNSSETLNDKNENKNSSESSTFDMQKTIDYRNIFGDLISSDKDKKIIEEQVEENTKQNLFYSSASETLIEKKSITENVPLKQELPRIAINDINRSLKHDEKVESSISNDSYSSPMENPFDKLDKLSNKNDEYIENGTNNKQDNLNIDVPFDKKYTTNNNSFDIPDYEVRYFNKDANSTQQTRFISINKLNLIYSFIVCIFACLFTTAILFIQSLNSTISTFQTFAVIVSYLIAFSILIIRFLKFVTNRNKKVESLNHGETIYSVFGAISIIILSLAINLFVGMNFNNIISYLSSFIIPLCYSIILISSHSLKKFLSHFSSFYN